jgi:hypothetical protein
MADQETNRLARCLREKVWRYTPDEFDPFEIDRAAVCVLCTTGWHYCRINGACKARLVQYEPLLANRQDRSL